MNAYDRYILPGWFDQDMLEVRMQWDCASTPPICQVSARIVEADTYEVPEPAQAQLLVAGFLLLFALRKIHVKAVR